MNVSNKKKERVVSNINEALRNAYYQGSKVGYNEAKKEILDDLKELIIRYNYSTESFDAILDYMRRKGVDI